MQERKAQENINLALTRDRTGALVLPEVQRINLAVIQTPSYSREALAVQGRFVTDAIKANPEVVDRMMEMALYKPDMFLDSSLDRLPTPRLEDIRRYYPDLISALPDNKADEVLYNFPSVQKRIQEERDIVSQIPGGTDIKTAEFVLKTLLDDGSVTAFTPEECGRIFTSYDLYVKLLESLIEQKGYVPNKERFIPIGRKLHLLKMQIDPSLQGGIQTDIEERKRIINEESTVARTHRDSQGEDQGQVINQIRAMQTFGKGRHAQVEVLQRLSRLSTDREVTDGLNQRVKDVGFEAERIEKMLKSNEQPGRADLTTAEIVHHHGYE